ncbi:hypothetical protein [Mesonia sp.]|uniref:hypothetical protein n=1 Tax=Mesonia sp. TaxID=1960830 RepID=UPI0017725897|nr:hypothetical protein [Mesonia sp.]HIB37599.1 hypothetical protein [Mesonia sp.]HIO27521.1 hypothetical protein [Flavobacteriaceae bacterium]
MANKIKRAYSVSNILNKKFKTMPFEGEWQKSFGKPSKEFSALVWGNSGNGKTDMMIQWAKYLCNFGRVAYNSMEEGVSHTFQMAMARHYLQGVEGQFILLDREPWDDMVERMSKHKSPDFLIVDSIQYAGIKQKQYKELKELMKQKGKGLLFLSHANGKNPKGALADFIMYDVDLKIWVEGFKAFPGGRLNGGGEPFTIWNKGAQEYWAEIN